MVLRIMLMVEFVELPIWIVEKMVSENDMISLVNILVGIFQFLQCMDMVDMV